MVSYEEALKMVKAEYQTRKDASHCEIIKTGLTYDGCTGFCVALYNYGDVVKITDIGETKEFFSEVTEEQWVDVCARNGFEFNHWRIERVFNSMQDVYDYIEFIDAICDIFDDMDEE